MRYNHVVLVGRLTRDAELKYTPAGEALVKLGLAVDQGSKEKKSTGFFDVTVFGKYGENCAPHLKKGRAILVGGRLNHRTWEQDGQKRSGIDIVANEVQYLDSPKDAAAGDGPPRGQEGGRW